VNFVTVENLSVWYQEVLALESVSLSIGKGKVIGILGPNGSGKTTLIKCMAGVLKPQSGRVIRHIDRKAVAYVPQRASVDWEFPARVKDVVSQGRYPHLGLWKRFGSTDLEIINRAIETMELSDLAERQIGELSGGQQQRVFLARALAQEGDLLLLDEPFQGVDALSEAALVRVLKHVKTSNRTAVVVHHDLQTVSAYFDEIILLNRVMIASGPTAETFTPKNVRGAYGGNVAIFSNPEIESGA